MDQSQLGSWSRAVTTADGTWMTRGFHSRKFTFSVRNYFNGFTTDTSIVKEELYQDTAKGYAANCTFSEAKKEGMNIEVHWQDADSSSSNALAEHFPNAKVMICGGRAHKKQ